MAFHPEEDGYSRSCYLFARQLKPIYQIRMSLAKYEDVYNEALEKNGGRKGDGWPNCHEVATVFSEFINSSTGKVTCRKVDGFFNDCQYHSWIEIIGPRHGSQKRVSATLDLSYADVFNSCLFFGDESPGSQSYREDSHAQIPKNRPPRIIALRKTIDTILRTISSTSFQSDWNNVISLLSQ